jgi:hypothetical protein
MILKLLIALIATHAFAQNAYSDLLSSISIEAYAGGLTTEVTRPADETLNISRTFTLSGIHTGGGLHFAVTESTSAGLRGALLVDLGTSQIARTDYTFRLQTYLFNRPAQKVYGKTEDQYVKVFNKNTLAIYSETGYQNYSVKVEGSENAIDKLEGQVVATSIGLVADRDFFNLFVIGIDVGMDILTFASSSTKLEGGANLRGGLRAIF